MSAPKSSSSSATGLQRTPRQQFDFVLMRSVRKPLRLLGLDVLDADYKPRGPLIAFEWLLICTYMAAVCKTVMYGTLEQSIETISYAAVCMQGPTKLYSGVRHHRQYQRLMEACRHVYRDVERSASVDLQRRTQLFSVWFVRVLNTLDIMVILAGTLLIVCPLLGWLVLGIEYMQMLPIMLPGVRVEEGIGYWLNQLLALLCTLFACCGILPSDSAFLFYVSHAYLRAMVLEFEVDECNRLLLSRRDEDACNVKQSRQVQAERQFKRVIAKHSEYFFYTQDVSSLYYYIATCEVYTDGVSLCSLVYIIMILGKYPAYMVFVVMLSKLLLFSTLGLVMELSNDKVYESLMSLHWYRMHRRPMRNMLFVTLMGQLTAPLRAGVEMLNMNLFVDVIKTVYSIAMMLTQMED